MGGGKADEYQEETVAWLALKHKEIVPAKADTYCIAMNMSSIINRDHARASK
jgi:hypothetical protein